MVPIANSANKNYERFWVQYSDSNSLLFRYITDNVSRVCPTITLDGENYKTSLRKHEYKNEFNIKVCQLEFSNTKPHEVKFRNSIINTKTRLNGPVETIGDTGCVVYHGEGPGKHWEQNCSSIDEYPFKRIVQNIADRNPDVIIHIGDYYYSMNKCVGDSSRAFGDNFHTWKVDFIDDAEAMFKSAPIIFTRGNHEMCHKGGKGWAVLFDSSINFRPCQKYTKPYNIVFHNVNFLMIDSAYANDFELNKDDFGAYSKLQDEIVNYTGDWDRAASLVDKDRYNVLLTHRPLVAFEARPWLTGSDDLYPLNYTLMESLEKSKFKRKMKFLDLIVSGHTHTGAFYEFQKFGSGKLTQIIAGNGGAMKNNKTILGKTQIGKYKIQDCYQHNDFGFTELNFNGQDATASFYTDKGALAKKKIFR